MLDAITHSKDCTVANISILHIDWSRRTLCVIGPRPGTEHYINLRAKEKKECSDSPTSRSWKFSSFRPLYGSSAVIISSWSLIGPNMVASTSENKIFIQKLGYIVRTFWGSCHTPSTAPCPRWDPLDYPQPHDMPKTSHSCT